VAKNGAKVIKIYQTAKKTDEKLKFEKSYSCTITDWDKIPIPKDCLTIVTQTKRYFSKKLHLYYLSFICDTTTDNPGLNGTFFSADILISRVKPLPV
jgi:hypothetical protein